jgi:ribA/ribD-fused uncharacterized protein
MTVFFYRESDPFGGFSNFSAHEVEVDGVVWPTSEHYFQAMKFPHDPKRQRRILQARTPGRAKRIAWEPKAKIRSGWDSARDEVMLRVLRLKFLQHPDLAQELLSTGREQIVEQAQNDSYWGCGRDGKGKNMLGRLLMRVREELAREREEQGAGDGGRPTSRDDGKRARQTSPVRATPRAAGR